MANSVGQKDRHSDKEEIIDRQMVRKSVRQRTKQSAVKADRQTDGQTN